MEILLVCSQTVGSLYGRTNDDNNTYTMHQFQQVQTVQDPRSGFITNPAQQRDTPSGGNKYSDPLLK